jgi:hypothetical protein
LRDYLYYYHSDNTYRYNRDQINTSIYPDSIKEQIYSKGEQEYLPGRNTVSPKSGTLPECTITGNSNISSGDQLDLSSSQVGIWGIDLPATMSYHGNLYPMDGSPYYFDGSKEDASDKVSFNLYGNGEATIYNYPVLVGNKFSLPCIKRINVLSVVSDEITCPDDLPWSDEFTTFTECLYGSCSDCTWCISPAAASTYTSISASGILYIDMDIDAENSFSLYTVNPLDCAADSDWVIEIDFSANNLNNFFSSLPINPGIWSQLHLWLKIVEVDGTGAYGDTLTYTTSSVEYYPASDLKYVLQGRFGDYCWNINSLKLKIKKEGSNYYEYAPTSNDESCSNWDWIPIPEDATLSAGYGIGIMFEVAFFNAVSTLVVADIEIDNINITSP